MDGLNIVENGGQVALREWILSGLKIPEVVALKGDAVRCPKTPLLGQFYCPGFELAST